MFWLVRYLARYVCEKLGPVPISIMPLLNSRYQFHLLLNLSIVDTIGNLHFDPYSEVFLTEGFRYISSRCGVCNWAIEHNVAIFSELSFTLCWQGRLVLRVTVLI